MEREGSVRMTVDISVKDDADDGLEGPQEGLKDCGQRVKKLKR